jgi:atypical dual specificity phosphatase
VQLSLGITHVLCVACDLPQPYPCDFVYQRVLIQDSCDAPLHTHFESCFQFIQSGLEAGGGVLVHCFAGRSRSATVVAAWLMCTHHLTMLEALAMVHAVRPQASPNAGFMRQLAAFEEQEHGSRSCLTRANSRLCACAPSQA